MNSPRELNLKRLWFSKIFVSTVSLLVLLSGIWSIWQNSIQLLPDVDPPKISFSISLSGVSEDFIISNFVKPYEDAILGKLTNLHELKVTTGPERALFEAEFRFGTNLDVAETELAALVSRARQLPLNVKPIEFRRGGSNVSNRVVASYFITTRKKSFSAQQLSLMREIAERQLKVIPGIETIEMNPTLDSHLLIKIDLIKLYHLGLSFDSVRNSLQGILKQPVVNIRDNNEVFSATFRPINTIKDIEKTPVAFIDGTTITLKDIADASVEPVPLSAAARYNGRSAIAMRILRSPDSNLVELQKQVDIVLFKNSKLVAAADLNYNLSFDTAIFIERAVTWVISALAAGFALSLVASFLFFRRIQPMILGGLITILATCGTFTVLYLMGISINIISLAGITFAIGMFVDSVLIFVEHLDRTPLKNKSSALSISHSMNALMPSLLASTTTTIVVFLPVIFGKGAEGQLFAGLSIAIVSGLTFAFALTILITPLFAYHFLQYSDHLTPGRYSNLAGGIAGLLKKKRNCVIFLATIFCTSFVGSMLLYPPLDYLPFVKRDAIDVYIPLPGNTSVERVEEEFVNVLSQELNSLSELTALKNSYAIGWNNFVTGAVRLENLADSDAAIKYLQEKLGVALPDSRVIVVQGELFGGIENSNSIKLYLFVSDTSWLYANAAEIRKVLTNDIQGVSLRFTPNVESRTPTAELIPNFSMLSRLKVSESDLKEFVQSMGRSDFIGKWSFNSNVIDVLLATKSRFMDLDQTPFVTPNGLQTYVGEMLDIVTKNSEAKPLRINGSSAVIIDLTITNKDLTVSDVVDKLRRSNLDALSQLVGKKGSFDLQGSAASIKKAKLFLVIMLAFAMSCFLLIVSISLRSPRLGFYVLCSLPSALFGGIAGFMLLRLVRPVEFNVLTMIGFMIMIGVVANNSILLVDSINRKYQMRGCTTLAIQEGIAVRIRAIFISSITTVLGMLPLLVFQSEASQIYQGIAAIIVGGIVMNLLTVFLVTGSVIGLFGLSGKSKLNDEFFENIAK